MKAIALTALSGILLTGCFPGSETDGVKTTPEIRDQAFEKDRGTVFLANFNGKSVNAVTGDTGTVTQASYPVSLFGSGLRMETIGSGKPLCLFPTTAPLSLSQGSMEALVRTDGPSTGFNHIIDKSWLYGLSNHDGKLAVHFGGGLHGWWYSSVALPLERWSYVAVTYDGDSLKLYLDGALAESTPNLGGNGDPSYDLGIGNASDAGFDIPFTGIIDEVRLSKVVRAPSEIDRAWKGIEKKINGR